MILSTARVHVVERNKRLQHVRVLLDSASQSNFITEETCNALGLKRDTININVTGISLGRLNITHRVELEIRSLHSSFRERITCLIVPCIADMLPTCTLDAKQFKIPANIKLADPTYHQPAPLDMLIGAGLFWSLLCVG